MRRHPSPTLFPYTTLFRSIESVDPATLTDNDRKVIDCIGDVAVVEGNAPSIIVNQLAIMLNDAEWASWATYQVGEEDRKSTRLNSSHQIISYAVCCLKKKT